MRSKDRELWSDIPVTKKQSSNDVIARAAVKDHLISKFFHANGRIRCKLLGILTHLI